MRTGSYHGMIRSMKVDKITISLRADLGEQVREAAAKQVTGVSSWLAEAALAKLRSEALSEFLDNWEAEHGPLTVDELRLAEAELGLPALAHRGRPRWCSMPARLSPSSA